MNPSTLHITKTLRAIQENLRAKFMLTVAALALLSATNLPAQAPQQQPVTPVRTSPLDEPLALLNKGRQVYQNVQDYSCTMVSQERIRGQLQPENAVLLKFRNQPFSVSMQWLAPQKFKGQEVCFVYGKNGNNMRVRSSGLAAVVGFVSIPPNDPRALEHSTHTITETGIWNLMERCRKNWEQERLLNRMQAKVGDYMFNNRRCKRIEVALTEKVSDSYCYRTILYLDEQTCLPVRIECYDWPQPGGSPQGELIEVYSYLNMTFNQNLSDRDFAK